MSICHAHAMNNMELSSKDTPVTQQEMERLYGLDAADKRKKDITGLKHTINLKWIVLSLNSISDLLTCQLDSTKHSLFTVLSNFGHPPTLKPNKIKSLVPVR